MSAAAIFDIGKTNKKFIIFDQAFNIIHQEEITIPETKDDDGFPCDDLTAIEEWMKSTFEDAISNASYKISKLNFSTYGATIVNLDYKGKPVTSLYNYLKPFPPELQEQFLDENGGEAVFCPQTASPVMGMLNSGLQLYWLKYLKPDLFTNIHQTLHLPQYFQYLFTGKMTCDFTSIGCHTGLWDFNESRYHSWVQKEEISPLLPEIIPTSTTYKINWKGQPLEVGVGINDSSASLLPYVQQGNEPFLLLSTGTWSAALFPYRKDLLTLEELRQDCVNFLRIDGKPVTVSRLFLGNEYHLQVEDMTAYFGKPKDYHKNINFDEQLYHRILNTPSQPNKWKSIDLPGIKPNPTANMDYNKFQSFEEAYHYLMQQLMILQQQRIKLALGSSKVRKVYVDGGFTKNEVFLKLMEIHLPGMEIIPSHHPLGSALGAAMVMNII